MPVPTHIFDEAWIKGGFIIPSDPTIRAELKARFKEYFRDTTSLFAPGNEKVRVTVQARLAALDNYDYVVACNPAVKL